MPVTNHPSWEEEIHVYLTLSVSHIFTCLHQSASEEIRHRIWSTPINYRTSRLSPTNGQNKSTVPNVCLIIFLPLHSAYSLAVIGASLLLPVLRKNLLWHLRGTTEDGDWWIIIEITHAHRSRHITPLRWLDVSYYQIIGILDEAEAICNSFSS